MQVPFDELMTTFEFLGGEFGNRGWVNRATGEIIVHSEFGDNFEELPDDIDEAEKYIELPSPRDLDLGRRLVMDFAAERLASRYDEIADIFSRKGAYRRFKAFLERVGALESWYEYEAQAKERALREWCAAAGLETGP